MQGKLLWKRKAYIPPLLWVAVSSGTLCPSPQLPTATEDCPVYIHGSSVGSRGNGVTAGMRDSCFVPYICQTSSYLHAGPSLMQWCPSKGSPENLESLLLMATWCSKPPSVLGWLILGAILYSSWEALGELSHITHSHQQLQSHALTLCPCLSLCFGEDSAWDSIHIDTLTSLLPALHHRQLQHKSENFLCTFLWMFACWWLLSLSA